MCSAAAAALLLAVAQASNLHPRPAWDQPAAYARWLIHESDYAIVSTHHVEDTFANVISISDGKGAEDSTGIIYTYMPSLDVTYQDVMANPNVSIAWSEMALEGGTSGGCRNSTAENPPCGRVVINGQLTKVPEERKQLALDSLFARHPVMKEWSGTHAFVPFWVDPASISDIFIINMYGGAKHPTVEEYLQAAWQAPNLPPDALVCSQCGHVFDSERDADSKRFQDLPADWTCPVCGASKSWFEFAGQPHTKKSCAGNPFTCDTGLFVLTLVGLSMGCLTIAGCGMAVAKRRQIPQSVDVESMSQSLHTLNGSRSTATFAGTAA